jgi:hypothetical protein
VRRGIRTSQAPRVRLRRVRRALFLDPGKTQVRHRTARETKIVVEKEEEGAWDRLGEGDGRNMYVFGPFHDTLLLCCLGTSKYNYAFIYTLPFRIVVNEDV